MNSVSSKLSTIIRAFWFLIVILSWNSAFANSYSKYVGESFYLPVPSLSVSNAAIYNYQWEPTLHVNIKNNSTCTVENPHIINSIYFRSIIKENDFNGKDQDRIYSNNYHSRW